MRSRTSTGLIPALVAFAALLAASLLLLAVSSLLEGLGGFWSKPGDWLARLDPATALDTLSNAAEVVAGVLAIAITVVAIVVELAATRYTHRITLLFISEPVNIAVMSFFVRDGESAEVDAPADRYELRYAGGVEWYGRRYLFGPLTFFMRVETQLVLTADTVGGPYILAPSADPGRNVDTTPITPGGF